MTTKMTNRDFFNAVMSADVSTEIKEYAQNELAKMDARNAKRSSTMTNTQKENIVLKEQILSVLSNEGKIASVIHEETGMSIQKVSALCRQLVEEGKIVVEDVRVPKKGMQKSYKVKKD